MIRPIMAVLIAATIILFVWQYVAFTERIRPQPLQIVENAAAGRYDVKVKCTCDCEGNSFGFAAVKVEFRGRILVERTGRVAAGETILIENVPDIKHGLNDFHVQVTPAQDSSGDSGDAFGLETPAESVNAGVANAVRVEVLHGGYLIASQMIWSDSSEPFGELVKINVRKESDDH